MKYLILVLSLVFSCYSYCQTQIPDLIIPIKFTFQLGAPPLYMQVGLDSTATDCLDPHLGEQELPPIPPPGWEAAIKLPYPQCQGILVHKDFRFGEQPYTGSRTHLFLFRADLGVTIHWDLPNGVTGLLQDVLTGGGVINYPIAGQDSFYVQYPFIDKLNLIIYYSNPPEPPVQVLSHITVTDGQILIPRKLYFGLDSTATDSIDTHLGESALPPFPPPGAFEARYILPENNFSGSLSSYSDFRYADLPFTGQKEWRLAYQTEYGNTITIIWNFPPFITGVLKDLINGTIINVSMADSGSYTVSNPYVYNQLRMIIDFDNAVPVELISFTASVLQNEKAVQLNWVTATEINNSGFEIHRKPHPHPFSEGEGSKALSFGEGLGEAWETIGFVPGFGTTTEPKSYSFVDENVTTGNYKYRLKQIDFDGSFTYSNELEVQVNFTPKEFVIYQNYPNPFNPSTTIKYSLPVESMVRINIYNALGEVIEDLVSKVQGSGNYEVTWNAQNYSSGIYYYSFEVNSADGSQFHREMKKIVYLK